MALKKKLLIVELWGLGDLTFSTTLISAALPAFEVHVLAKPHAVELLRAAFPDVRFIEFDAPWTAFRNKYRLWTWPWRRVITLTRAMRAEHFDVAVSVRKDPRDHLLMFLAGARRRVGFALSYTRMLLTDRASAGEQPRHRIEDWHELARGLGLQGDRAPQLLPNGQRGKRAEATKRCDVVLHAGARIPTRRWSEANFSALIAKMRQAFTFNLILVPDPDGYGVALSSLADEVRNDLTLTELIQLLAQATLVVCNDSGPMHIAAAVGTPTVAIFGPTDARVFRPWGSGHKVVERDLCVYRPCFDYCRFPEPYCLTRLPAEKIWPEVRDHLQELVRQGSLPSAFGPRLDADEASPAS